MIRLIALCLPVLLLAKEITVEHAVTPDQIAWGLMGRKELKEDHGMLFHFRRSAIRSFWMFNCYIDLSLAYLDEEGTILSLHELKSYPDKVFPIKHPQELRRLSSAHPSVIFFQNRAVFSPFPSRYALEMNAGWFKKNNIQVGDKLHWNIRTNVAKIIKTTEHTEGTETRARSSAT